MRLGKLFRIGADKVRATLDKSGLDVKWILRAMVKNQIPKEALSEAIIARIRD